MCYYFLLPSIRFTYQNKSGVIDFTTAAEHQVYKAKNGHLTVVRYTSWGFTKAFEELEIALEPVLTANKVW